MARLVIDPITRIGGHLRLEVSVANGAVEDAWSSGTMFRGMEQILRGRDPRDAWLFAQRICGACTGVHALASVRAVENAFGIVVPKNARLVRNILAGSQFVADHVTRFYLQQALDWVDLEAAVRADPAVTSTLARTISDWPKFGADYFSGVRDRLATFLASGQPGPFARGSWGHPAYELTPEANLLLFAHYLEAIDWQRDFGRLQVLLGGKYPHPQTYLVGGMAISTPWGGPVGGTGEHPQMVDRNAPAALGSDGLADLRGLLTRARAFVEQVYVPDVLLLGRQYPRWASLGAGIGSYLAYGEFPEDDSATPKLLLARGRVMDRSLVRTESVDQSSVTETVAHSWYRYDGDAAALGPWDGQTNPAYAGPRPPFTSLEGSDRYSWLKAPRYDGFPVEVGPLARILASVVEGRQEVRAATEVMLSGLGIAVDALFSTLGRTVARAIEAQVLVVRLPGWLQELTDNLATGDVALADLTRWDPGTWPDQADGVSLGEGSRGAVGHWLKIRGRTIANYQVVDATTWNGSPRDAQGRRGALEEALIGTPVVDPDRPVEILRTLRSFDPCPACAVHLHRPGGGAVELHVAQGGGR